MSHTGHTRALLIAASGAAGAALSGAVAGQPALGIAGDPGLTVLHTVAACVYNRDPKSVSGYLAASPGSAGWSNQPAVRGVILQMQPCLNQAIRAGTAPQGYQMRFPHFVIRGALAELAISQLESAKFKPAEARTRYEAPWLSSGLQQAAVERLGWCLAALYPAESFALISTAPQTSEERKGAGVLSPFVKACVPDGMTIEGDSSLVRATVAFGLYHVLVDPAQQSTDSAAIEKN